MACDGEFRTLSLATAERLEAAVPTTPVTPVTPALTEKQDKTSRMDIRLTPSRRKNYEYAAALRGMTLTQWATSNLDENARRDIESARRTVLSSEAFDEFCEMLDAPVPQAALDLLARKPVWE